jgi:hypothetical protein
MIVQEPWIYDTDKDEPRPITTEDWVETKTMLQAYGEFRYLMRQLEAHKPGDAQSYFKWVRRLRETVKDYV